MDKFSKFCRALIPADAFQSLFLFGVVLISFSRQLGWYSRPLIFEFTQEAHIPRNFVNFMALAVLPTVFAGCAGYFVCFWPGKHPVRRMMLAVLLPAVSGLLLVFFNYASLVTPTVSVLYRKKPYFSVIATLASDWKLFPTAFYACLLGVILVLLFLQRLGRGKPVLPLSFPVSPDDGELGPELPRRFSILVFALPALVFFTSCTSTFIFWLLPSGRSPALDTLFNLSPAFQALILLLVSALIVGLDGLRFLWKVLQLPPPRFVGWACAIGVVLGFFIPTLRYLYERSHWAAFDFGRVGPPRFSDSVAFHGPGSLIFGLIVVAICEEMVMRGLLQPGLLDRFGMHRGIIFTAVIWGAYEFHLYSFARYSVLELFIAVAIFFGSHIVLSYLYAWTYLKSGSIVPAIVLHAILSLSILFRVEVDFPAARYARVVVWAIGALLLYRFWPVSRQMASEVDMSGPDPSPAVSR
jgi:membrane protease YdiL (CAAX protease family)